MAQTLGKAFSLVGQVGSGEKGMLRGLSPEMGQLLRLRFGIGDRRHSLAELAARFGVTVAALRRSETRAFRRLRALAIGTCEGLLRASARRRGRSWRAPSAHAAGVSARRTPRRRAS